MAAGVDPEIKAANLKRLRRIEGQIRGIHKMIDEDRYCADTLTQIAAVQQALKGVSRELVRNHLKHCLADAMREGDEAFERVCDELAEIVHRSWR